MSNHHKLDLIHRRNSLMLKLLWGLFVLNALKFLFDDVSSHVPTAFGFVFLVLLSLLSLRRQFRVFTMYSIVFSVFGYFFVLLLTSPYPVNFLFVWLGLVLVVLYQSYAIILLAASLSISLSVYFYLTTFRIEYPTISEHDILYVVMFGVFLTILLMALVQFTERLEQEAEYSREQLRRVLDSAEVAIWSVDMGTQKVSVSTGIERITGYPAEEFSENTQLWEEVILEDDRRKVLQAKEILESGEPQTVDYRLMHADGTVRWVQNRIVPFCSSSGQPLRLEGVLIDITERKEMEQQILHLAYHDLLTGLPNRTLFEQLSTTALLRAKRQGLRLAVMFIDLDDFKETNDRFGHEFGDRALKSVAERLATGIRESDTLCRIGGDEFVAVAEINNPEEAKAVAIRIIETCSPPLLIGEQQIEIRLSIGVSIYPDDGESISTLVQAADRAMYKAKAHGGNRWLAHQS